MVKTESPVPRFPAGWRALRDGLYFYPGAAPVLRRYGYVSNVIHQVGVLLEAPARRVDEKVYYVGGQPFELLDYVNGFSLAITGREVRIVLRVLIRMLVPRRFAGARRRHVPHPNSRFHGMAEEDPTLMEPRSEAFGEPPYSMEEGIRKTTQWLRRQGFFAGAPAWARALP